MKFASRIGSSTFRSWSWWFGFGKCRCETGWSGSCCDDWSVSDWDAKVDAWNRGNSCEAQPGSACKEVSNSPAALDVTQSWKYEPDGDLDSQSKCEEANCMWVSCFESTNNQFNMPPADEMCSHCSGLWEGKCEWHSYEPGALAFAGPGKHCGFKYPSCPESKGKSCFCGQDAIDELREGWCNNGMGMATFCPSAIDHGDGRKQACSWNGWSITMDFNKDIPQQCEDWGVGVAGDPTHRTANKLTQDMEFKKVEPGAAVEGTQIGAAACFFLGAGGFLMKKRQHRQAPGAEKLELTGTGAAV
ncbi:hypothetical protein TrRE_jg9152 [Triparma retinervis]|uniref:Uncharacterized protein n=1 Tax=Triparma retinervis TaxID=2557542 RepID=A0A9W6ZGQ7_9STRA|nr:hypothetical protein TrRE_jg9152 [Triparma retinervis]